MSLTSRQKRPFERSGQVRDARLIIIATEGEKTEKIYFSVFHSTKIQVKTLPTEKGRSAPEHVFSRLKEFQDKFELKDDDELWLAIDRDKWTIATIRKIAAQCFKEKIGFALSNPCFEIWLSMHYGEITDFPEKLDSKEAEKFLKSLCGSYSKSKFNPSLFLSRVPHAIAIAKELDTHPKARWPNKTGSHVYKIIDSIQNEKDS